MKAYGVSDIGKNRKINEDFYYLPQVSEHFAAVADGMGGHAAGEVASFMAIRELSRFLRKSPTCSEARMKSAFEAANSVVNSASVRNAERTGMGTTMTAVWVSGNVCYMGHVGDSRAYRLRDGKLEQMSVDHSYVEELVRGGIITREQARSHPKRNIITRCIGVYDTIAPQVLRLDWREADVWLLASDGLVGYVTDEEIETVLLEEGMDMPQKLNALKQMALDRGGADNVTVVALCGGGDA
ncbi:MAG: Stp1/IreP family PP2C-type Ser/Thr phosphatase [Clostridia bacterium]|nr:Stp1/IreP family PP2C-type Ser/Thr phosphatase [Clostridia bacterium]